VADQAKQTKASIDIGLRIQKKRKKNGLTSIDFGKVMGVSGSTITNWEAGRAAFPAHQLIKIAKKLGVSPAWLLTGEGEMEKEKVDESQR
jgi:transcriptional regulator with XRE-family HTH domain